MRFLLSLLLLCAAISFAGNHLLDSLVAYTSEKAPDARLGISLRSVKTDSLVFNYNGKEFFTPASTMKLLVTAAALQQIPLSYAPQTTLYLEGIKRKNTFSGVLTIKGGGDPNISARYFPNALYQIDSLTSLIKTKGIDTIRGILNLDTSFFAGPRKPDGWRKKFLDSWYGAEVSPLSFNDNCVLIEIVPGEKEGDSAKITVVPDVGYVKIINNTKTQGKGIKYKYALNPNKPEITFSGTVGLKNSLSTVVLPVRNPSLYFEAAFLKSLETNSIAYIPDSAVYKGKAIYTFDIKGPPLRSLLDEINQRSQNLHSEILLRTLGQNYNGDGSARSGIISEKVFLDKIGINANDFKVIDGSGLSPENLLKPNSLTKLLAYMKRQKLSDVYYSSLAIPGVSGAGKRLANVKFKDKIRFKTGFIDGVHGLVGYIAADGDTLAYALYLNNAQKVKENLARDILDTLAGRITDYYNSEIVQLEKGNVLYKSAEGIDNLNERIIYFSNKLKGTPYFLGPMGEGLSVYPSYKPRINFKEVDCVTYMEHVLALAYAKDYDDFFDILQGIRYKDGVISYKTRNHFLIADWVANNKTSNSEGSATNIWAWKPELKNNWDIEFDIFEKEIDKKKFFKDTSIVNPKINIPFLPKDRAIVFADTVKFARDTIFGAAILSELIGLDAAHTGFVIGKGKKDGLMFRHASQLKGGVIEEPLSDFLRKTKIKTAGISFFEFSS